MRCDFCFYEYEGGDFCPKCGFKRGGPADELFYLRPGTVLNGRYTIGQSLGAGGFGIVYKAWDSILHSHVAIKEYYPSGLVIRIPGTGRLRVVAASRVNEFNNGKNRFIAECNGTIMLDERFKENTSLLHGVSTFDDNGTAYMVMEFLDGTTLTNLVKPDGLDNPDGRTNPMAVSEGLSMITAILGAVRDLHAAGVIHRDISPDNIIILADGTAKLIDLGAAKFGKNDNIINAERILKPGYSPPEQYEPDGNAGVHTDIYSVGATLYFALSGIKPFEATTRKDSREGDILPAPQNLREDIPKNISNAILTAMEVDYRMRFKSADEFLKALRGEVKVYGRGEKGKRLKRRRLISIAASLVILFAAAAITFMLASEQIPTLPDATIELWYVLTENEDIDMQKKNAYEQIIAEFVAIYPNVIVNLHSISNHNYEAEVAAAISHCTPVLFESDSINDETLSGSADISAVANSMRSEVYFLDRYSRMFPEKNRIPTGFKVSCIFINTTLSSYLGDGTGDLSDLLASMQRDASKMAVFSGHEDDFSSVFGSVPFVDSSSFFSNETGALFADTSMLSSVQSAFVGRYKLLRIDMPEIPAYFGGMYSVPACTGDELRVLIRLLEFMLDGNAQDALHIQTQNGLIPLNKNEVETYQDVFYDFSYFFKNTENYVFN